MPSYLTHFGANPGGTLAHASLRMDPLCTQVLIDGSVPFCVARKEAELWG
jgi:hypothetical protein